MQKLKIIRAEAGRGKVKEMKKEAESLSLSSLEDGRRGGGEIFLLKVTYKVFTLIDMLFYSKFRALCFSGELKISYKHCRSVQGFIEKLHEVICLFPFSSVFI